MLDRPRDEDSTDRTEIPLDKRRVTPKAKARLTKAMIVSVPKIGSASFMLLQVPIVENKILCRPRKQSMTDLELLILDWDGPLVDRVPIDSFPFESHKFVNQGLIKTYRI